MELNVEVMEKLDIATAGGWLLRLVRPFCARELCYKCLPAEMHPPRRRAAFAQSNCTTS